MNYHRVTRVTSRAVVFLCTQKHFLKHIFSSITLNIKKVTLVTLLSPEILAAQGFETGSPTGSPGSRWNALAPRNTLFGESRCLAGCPGTLSGSPAARCRATATEPGQRILLGGDTLRAPLRDFSQKPHVSPPLPNRADRDPRTNDYYMMCVVDQFPESQALLALGGNVPRPEAVPCCQNAAIKLLTIPGQYAMYTPNLQR